MSRVLSRWLPGAILLSLAASGAHAQGTVFGASLAAELDSATGVAVAREVERASARGLPTAPLIAKAREGRLKRAAGPRIRQAVAAMATRLDSARVALGPTSSADELVAGADALAVGADPDALRAIRRASAQSSVSTSLGALAQLVANGIPARRAAGMLVDLLRQRATAAQVVAFGNAVEMDVASGLPVDEAATFRLRSASAAVAGSAALSSIAPTSAVAPPPPSGTPPRRP